MDYRARERQRKSDRPAKLNEKKGDRDLEREIKNKGDIFLLEEQHVVAAVTMLTAINARRKWAAVKKSEQEHLRHCRHEKVSGSFTL